MDVMPDSVTMKSCVTIEYFPDAATFDLLGLSWVRPVCWLFEHRRTGDDFPHNLKTTEGARTVGNALNEDSFAAIFKLFSCSCEGRCGAGGGQRDGAEMVQSPYPPNIHIEYLDEIINNC